MPDIKILYDYQHAGFIKPLEAVSSQINELSEDKVKITFTDGFSLTKKAIRGDFKFIIIHLGNNEFGAYKQADELRKLSPHSVLVAESSNYPYGEEEILKHFDDYIGLYATAGGIKTSIEQVKTDFIGFLKKYGCLNNI